MIVGAPATKKQPQKTGQALFKPALPSTLILLVCVLTFIFLALFGCASEKPASNDKGTERIRVITTVFASYDFAKQVAGPHAEVRMLTSPGSDIHSFEPTPQDILDIENCEFFIYVGGESDEWVKDLLDSIDTSGIVILRLFDCVEVRDEDDSVLVDPNLWAGGEKETDEHVWTSMRNAKLITRAISDRFKELDPKNTEEYEANTQAYLRELDELDSMFKKIVAEGKSRPLVFGDRFPFFYFADEYGLRCYAAFPGCSTATEPSARTIALLIDLVKAEHIPVVFYLEMSNQRLADTIAEETGAKTLLLHSCHTVSRQDFESGETYVSLMRKNAQNLKAALS